MKKAIFGVVLLLIMFYCKPVLAQSGCCSSHDGVSGSCTSDGRAMCNDGSVSPSCTDSGAKNYSTSATMSDGSCIYPVLGCIGYSA